MTKVFICADEESHHRVMTAEEVDAEAAKAALEVLDAWVTSWDTRQGRHVRKPVNFIERDLVKKFADALEEAIA